ncbi:phage baseplate protein [Raoultibacter timonensis]|uniref:phage baseplate protein n=1 Tax=Raoultibacter timonensis TaxID=1907662 RepID=UPI0026DD2514|nr:hypothetical protein [Raoultibacter timonensis]
MTVQEIDLGRVVGIDAEIEIGTVTTLAPGEQATVENVGEPTHAVLDFGIPQGPQGETVVPDGSITDASVAEGAAISGSKLADGSVPESKMAGVLGVGKGGTGVTTDKAIALKSWPVGSVYLSWSPTSPASLFGGTWAQISGRFLRAANDTAAGGSDTHTLTVAQTPSHAHVWKMGGKERVGYGISGSAGSFVDGLALSSSGSAISIDPSGGSQPHSNMPAYQDVYAWRRTA